MPSPRERLEKLIAAHIPSEVVFRSATKTQEASNFEFSAVVVKERAWVGDDSDPELKVALIHEIAEEWSTTSNRYIINTTADRLWERIKYTIVREYDRVSSRCTATKRKTEKFIQKIGIDDKHLPNFLIQMFLTVSSPTYTNKTRDEREKLFEQFESLRRTYGK